jgi:hypothetical protein
MELQDCSMVNWFELATVSQFAGRPANHFIQVKLSDLQFICNHLWHLLGLVVWLHSNTVILYTCMTFFNTSAHTLLAPVAEKSGFTNLGKNLTRSAF